MTTRFHLDPPKLTSALRGRGHKNTACIARLNQRNTNDEIRATRDDFILLVFLIVRPPNLPKNSLKTPFFLRFFAFSLPFFTDFFNFFHTFARFAARENPSRWPLSTPNSPFPPIPPPPPLTPFPKHYKLYLYYPPNLYPPSVGIWPPNPNYLPQLVTPCRLGRLSLTCWPGDLTFDANKTND